ncbi:hypothetical protein B0T18DRAFT_424115 [Schizothecium vesticola]|uniref:Uncharacterized protein n=1 Tax=Schizothecium vesticola TaxID=314040 RepID=A0AA40F9B9_9PEZI|nr:hypothetical protein B0T18DRAFT_424115 [Schizothecium vesticola]
MAAIMTRVPSDALWPSGAIENDVRFPFPSLGTDSSIISPLSLPRGASGYFDQIYAKKGPSPTQVSSASQMPPRHTSSGGRHGNRVYSPLSPGARVPPHLSVPQHRSTSLPPMYRSQPSKSSTPRAVAALGLIQGPSTQNAFASGLGKLATDGSMSSVGTMPASQPRTTSAESPGAHSQSLMIRRLVQQNSRIREAWEAERKYMEANRERAEEVYKEERAFMEEERMEWDDEKAMLLQEIERLRQQVRSLGGNAARPRGDSVPGSKNPHAATHSLRGGPTWEASPESMRSSTSSQGADRQNAQTARNAPSLPQLVGEGPSSTSFGAVSFRAASASELSAVPETEVEEGPVPIVDVQEIHPELEGIPIKANTIQKPTFTDSQAGSKSSSRASSPSSAPDRPKGARAQTLQVLAAEESSRLTMHAGHTPNHSLSVFSTAASSEVQTARSSGESTPTMFQTDATNNQALSVADEQPPAPATSNPDRFSTYHDEPEPLFEPREDRELKGPLMVRNMPAHDEIFFRRLSDKLEEVSRGNEAALPAVLKDVGLESDSTDPAPSGARENQPHGAPEARPDPQRDDRVGGDSDSGTEKDRRSPTPGTEGQMDIPLKFKSSMNFGAPFGTFR